MTSWLRAEGRVVNERTDRMDVLVVGAGFSGAVVARELAEAGREVTVIDKRPHVAGNASDYLDAHGVMVHRYGPHIFHTNSERIVRWLSRFTAGWRPYEHRVLAQVDGMLLPIPINRTTINRLYGLQLDEEGVQAFFESVREPRTQLKTSEDVVLNSVGRDLCDKFFRGYTRKQWGLELSELAAGVAARIPTRTNEDARYFTDTFQQMPADGYTAMFERMLDHPRITLRVGIDFSDIRTQWVADTLVYTGPIDEYFNHCLGRLPYRSLRFEHRHIPGVDLLQACGTVNYPNDHAYTRVTEFKHLTGQRVCGTSLVFEYPQDCGEPYYPVPHEASAALYRQYQALAELEDGVHFVGRLAQYRYYNMDQAVAAALVLADRLKRERAS